MHEPPNDDSSTCEMSTTAVERKMHMYEVQRSPAAVSAQRAGDRPGPGKLG